MSTLPQPDGSHVVVAMGWPESSSKFIEHLNLSDRLFGQPASNEIVRAHERQKNGYYFTVELTDAQLESHATICVARGMM